MFSGVKMIRKGRVSGDYDIIFRSVQLFGLIRFLIPKIFFFVPNKILKLKDKKKGENVLFVSLGNEIKYISDRLIRCNLFLFFFLFPEKKEKRKI